jgi:hypothetical protein
LPRLDIFTCLQWAFTAETLYDAATLLVVCLLLRSEWHVQLAASQEAATTFLRVCAARIIDADRQPAARDDVAPITPPLELGAVGEKAGRWACVACTYENGPATSTCEMCSTRR